MIFGLSITNHNFGDISSVLFHDSVLVVTEEQLFKFGLFIIQVGTLLPDALYPFISLPKSQSHSIGEALNNTCSGTDPQAEQRRFMSTTISHLPAASLTLDLLQTFRLQQKTLGSEQRANWNTEDNQERDKVRKLKINC